MLTLSLNKVHITSQSSDGTANAWLSSASLHKFSQALSAPYWGVRYSGKIMSVVEALLESSEQYTSLLINNDSKGDNFDIPRNIDFVFKTDDAQKAETVCSFINDNNYANARVESVKGDYRVLAVVAMQSNQNVICSVSGLMTCIGKLFDVEYDGWGCVLQNT